MVPELNEEFGFEIVSFVTDPSTSVNEVKYPLLFAYASTCASVKTRSVAQTKSVPFHRNLSVPEHAAVMSAENTVPASARPFPAV